MQKPINQPPQTEEEKKQWIAAEFLRIQNIKKRRKRLKDLEEQQSEPEP